MGFTGPRATVAALALALAGAGACSSTGKSEGQVRIEALSKHIQALQAEFQRCRADLVRSLVAHDSLISLEEGDLLGLYSVFNKSLRAGESRIPKIDRLLDDVRGSGEAFYSVWQVSLESISDDGLRRQGGKRLQRSRAQLDDVLAGAAGAREALDPLVRGMRDHAIFLGNDLNAESIALLGEDRKSLQREARAFYENVDEFLEAGKAFNRNAAMQIPATPVEASAR